MPTGEDQDGITAEEQWALLERIAGSKQLRRAARLRDFLTYVGTQRVRHMASTIREQEIGEAVFGRTADYDTSLDNIVRVNATELRKRLEQYFQEEGSIEELVLTIPRGSYTPLFHRRSGGVLSLLTDESGSDAAFAPPPLPPSVGHVEAAPEMFPEDRADTPLSQPQSNRRMNLNVRLAWIATASIFAILLLLLASALWQNRKLWGALEPWRSEPSLARLWGEFFSNNREIDVVVADTSLALAKDISGQAVSLDDYLNFRYKNAAEKLHLSADRAEDLQLVLERNNGSIGDFRVAQRIFALNPNSTQLKLKSAREFTSEAIRQNSVILIGSRESNPWVDLYKDQLNFLFQYDRTTHRSYVLNRSPKAGELHTYETPPDPVRERGFATVAFLPDLSGTGHALIIGGTDSQATRAAGEFITSDALRLIERQFPPGTVPPFEVLLQTSQLTGTPMRSELLAVRIAGR